MTQDTLGSWKTATKNVLSAQSLLLVKKDKSIKLAPDSKYINKQIYKKKYQMPKIHDMVGNVAAQIAIDSVGEICFTNLDLKNA